MTGTKQWPADNEPSTRWPIYTRGNVGEVYPDVVLPLEWDLGGAQSEQGWRNGAKAIGFVTDADFDEHDFDEPAGEADSGQGGSDNETPMTFIGVFGGYAYFNASLMRLLGVRTPGVSVDLIDQQFLGGSGVEPYRETEGDRNRVATARLVRSAVATLTARKVPLVAKMAQRANEHRAGMPPLNAPDTVLHDYITRGLEANWEFFIRSHVIVSMRAMIASGNLSDLCEAKLGDANLAVVLTTGIGDVRSAGPAKEMWRLANETPQDEFDDAFEDFLLRFGHRGPNEFSIAGRDWASHPEIALAAINQLRGLDPNRSPQVQAEKQKVEHAKVLAEARQKMGWQARRLDAAIASTALWSRAREESKDEVIRAVQATRLCIQELARRAREGGGVEDHLGPMLLTHAEFQQYVREPGSMVAVIEERRTHYAMLSAHEPPFAFSGQQPNLDTWTVRGSERNIVEAGQVLVGAAGAPGTARGTARVVTDPSDPSIVGPGDILIAPLTDPSWTPLFLAAEGVVVEVGAAMSHSMIVSRELGIPCVVGVEGAASCVPDGAVIEVDGQAGTVTIIST